MNLSGKQQLVFDKLSAIQTMADKTFPLANKLKKIKSTADNPIDFLVNLFRATIGIDSLLNTLNTYIYDKLDYVENLIKKGLVIRLNSIISCSLNPSLTEALFETGIDIDVEDIDIMGMFKIDPNSVEGDLIYNVGDNEDLNIFLFNLFSNTAEKDWKGILTIKYLPIDSTNPKDRFNVKINESYKSKTLKQLTEDIIFNIKFFNKKSVIARLFDSLFGSISYDFKKNINQLLLEREVHELINKIINSEIEEDITIDDSFFSFSNKQYDKMLKETQDLIKAKKTIITNKPYELTLDTQELIKNINTINDDITLEEQQNVFTNTINNIIGESGVDKKDQDKVKGSIIENLIREFALILANSVLTPKILFVMFMNFKILNVAILDKTPKGIIKTVLRFIEPIIIEVKNDVLNFVLEQAMKYINQQLANISKIIANEIAENVKRTMSSLTKVNKIANILK